MSENKQIIQNVFDIITKFNNIEGNDYHIVSIKFRHILYRENYTFEYNFLPFMSKNLEVFKKYLDGTITLEHLKYTIKEDGWDDFTINNNLDNLHKVTLTYDKLYEICFTRPNKVDSFVENLLNNFSDYDIEVISYKLMVWRHNQFKKKIEEDKKLISVK